MNEKNSLELLFGSKEKWRIMKMLVLNGGEQFLALEIAEKANIDGHKVSTIVAQLVKIGFARSLTKNKKKYYEVNKNFPFFQELKKLVMKSNVYPQCKSLGRIKDLGDVKLSLVTGVFIDNSKSKADLLVVGDQLSKAKVNHLLRLLEAEMGREINYVIMDMKEFRYRVNMFDKFIMEFLNEPHEVVVNKISNEIRQIKKNRRR